MPNRATLRLRFVTVERRLARDPSVRVEVRAVKNNKLLRRKSTRIPPAPAFKVPAIPDPYQNLFVRVIPANFRDTNLEPFALTDDATKTFFLFRRPDRWAARFTRWSDLGRPFGSLRRVLNDSSRIKVIGGPVVEKLAGTSYDAVDPARDKIIHAKAALLNLYSKLTELKDPLNRRRRWFNYVKRIIKIGRERFVAVVEPTMASHGRTISRNIERYDDYERTNARNHYGNFPSAFKVSKKADELFSIKSSENLANLQLTLGRGTDPDTDRRVWLLDTDIDEHGDLWGHVGDLIKHTFTGGTHPYDVHELLLFLSRERDLGYSLHLDPHA